MACAAWTGSVPLAAIASQLTGSDSLKHMQSQMSLLEGHRGVFLGRPCSFSSISSSFPSTSGLSRSHEATRMSRNRLVPRAEAPYSSGGRVSATATQQTGEKQTVLREQNRRLLAMQKELLEQIEERKRLHAALLDSLKDPASTIKSFNEGESMGLPSLSKIAATPSVVPIAPEQPTMPAHVARSLPVRSVPASSESTDTQWPSVSTPAPLHNLPPIVKPSPPAPLSRSPQARATPTMSPSITPSTTPPRTLSPPSDTSSSSSTPSWLKPASAAPVPPPPKVAPPPPPVTYTYSPPPPAVEAPPPPAIHTPTITPVPWSPPAQRSTPWADTISYSPPAPEPETPLAPPSVPEPMRLQAPEDPPEEQPPLAGENVMNVVVVASECAPWSKTGGLGDVVGSLPKALARRGHRVMVIAPRYSNYEELWDTTVRKRYNVAGQDCEVAYFHGFIDGVDFVFVDHPMYHGYAQNIYGGNREEIQKRMILLCKAALEAPWHVPCGGICYGDANLVFVCNDWHTSLLPVYLQAYYRDHGQMQFARSVLVVHNMAHQGRAPLVEFERLGLPQHYIDKFQLYDPVGGEHMNIFMAGMITAHRLVAVSHGYAWECQTPDGGWGLHNVMKDHNWKLRGVVNGIDTVEWNPSGDVFLTSDGYQQFDTRTLDMGKAACKRALQRELGLPDRPDVPLLGFIGRLDYQKGVDIIKEAMGWLMTQDVQLVMLGTGRQDLEDMLRQMEGQHKDKCRGWVGFSVKMAHRITAGSDLLLMPSRFEPCGLNQLYAMRYGTVPVVHSVGGLRDTVTPFDPFKDEGLGWAFDRAEVSGLQHALGNALYTYKEFRDSFRKVQLRGMTQDLSWDNAAQQYEEVLVAAKYQW